MIAGTVSNKRTFNDNSLEGGPPGKFPKACHSVAMSTSPANPPTDTDDHEHSTSGAGIDLPNHVPDDGRSERSSTTAASDTAASESSSINKFSEQRDKLKELYIAMLKTFEQNVRMDVRGRPHARTDTRWKSYVSIPDFDVFSDKDRVAWRLCTLLFDPQPDAELRLHQFRNWLLDYVSARADAAAECAAMRNQTDRYVPIFVYLTYGSLQGAANAAIQADDAELAYMIASSPAPPSLRELHTSHTARLDALRRSGQFDTFTPYQQRIWRILCGDMTALDDIRVDWRQAFVLYIMYATPAHCDRTVDPLDALIGLYIEHFEDPLYYSMSLQKEGDALDPHERLQQRRRRPSWYTVVKFWRNHRYHPDQLHLDHRHPLHLDNWSPWLALCFSTFFPQALPVSRVQEWMDRVYRQLQRIGVPISAIPSILAPSS